MEKKTFPLKIGLEVHGYLDTEEKLFCKCKTSFLESKPNSIICPICTGQPGSKPMLPNQSAMDKLIKISLILNCKINLDKDLIWQRKHYNWSDLPKGYQSTISGAYAVPVAVNGKFNGIRITEAHLEEDPAQWNPETGGINYNRSGLPLVEIVTEPDFTSSEQAITWLKSLVHSLSYIKAIRKNGGIKVDVNVSTYGERVEMKNLNSLNKIKKAIEYEIIRQVENYEKGIIQTRDTLAFDEKLGKTIKMRSKEGAADYRFIQDPDLPVIKIDKKRVIKLKSEIPEMPSEKLKRLLKEYNIEKSDAEILIRNLELVDFFEELSKQGIDMKKNISWITIELLRVLNYNKKTLEDSDINVRPEHLAELISMIDKKELTVLKAKQIMNDFIPNSFSLKEHKDEILNIDETAIKNFCKKVIENNQHVVSQYREGNTQSINFLMGQVMRLSEKRANPNIVKEILKKLI